MSAPARVTPACCALLALLACCVPASASAQQADRDARPDPNSQTTAQECDADRRCRLDRLKRRGRARRFLQVTEDERYVQRYMARVEQKRKEAIHRAHKPLSVNYVLSFLSPVGFSVGYALGEGRWVPEVTMMYADNNLYGDVNIGGQSVYFDGYQSGWFFQAGVSRMFGTGWWSPYLSVAAIYGRPEFYAYYYGDDFGEFGGGTSGGLRNIYHILHLGGGFDVQLGFGGRLRLGAYFRPTLYVQSTYGDGNYDDTVRQGTQAWWNSNQRIGIEGSLGWAF